uniref:Uncharacterized protein n=1 Tax=Arundo donax TaxID=35708 RepID=A0A0A9E4L1_ARUDO
MVLKVLFEMGSGRSWKLMMQLTAPCLVMMADVELEQEKCQSCRAGSQILISLLSVNEYFYQNLPPRLFCLPE